MTTDDTRARELAMLQRDDVHRQILDAIADMVLVKGAHSRILWGNRAFREYYGMSNEELQQLVDAPFNAPDHTQQYVADDLHVFTTGAPLDIPMEPVTRHDGVVHTFHTVKSALRDVDGRVRMTVGVSRNIGETVALRDEVMRFRTQLERDRLSAFAAQLPGVLFQMRSDVGVFRFTYASPSVADYYGVDDVDVLADPVAVLRNIEGLDAVFAELTERMAKARTQGEPITHIHRVRGRDGVVRAMEVFLRARVESDHSYTVYAYAHDVTERERVAAEREALIETLRMRNREMEQFTYTISHDLKSPLVTIRGFVTGIEEDLRAGRTERALADLARVRGAAEKMSRMLEELLELSRVGRVTERFAPFALGDAIADATELLTAQLTQSGAIVDVDGGAVVVDGDRGRITQVFQNLIENAVRYRSDAAPHITIHVACDNDVVDIVVADNGIGIAPTHHQRVFGLFEKLDAKSEGTGVGLALVKSIVELHRGQIWIDADARPGTTVHVRLPARASAAPVPRR